MQTNEIPSFKSNNIKLRSNRCFLSFLSIATCTSSIAISDSRRPQLLYNLFSPLRRRYNHLRIHTRLNVSATVKPVTVSYVTGSFAWRNFSDALFLLLFFLPLSLPPSTPSFILSFLSDFFSARSISPRALSLFVPPGSASFSGKRSARSCGKNARRSELSRDTLLHKRRTSHRTSEFVTLHGSYGDKKVVLPIEIIYWII